LRGASESCVAVLGGSTIADEACANEPKI